jgi:DNA-binding NarL/FixJ family response regulator
MPKRSTLAAWLAIWSGHLTIASVRDLQGGKRALDLRPSRRPLSDRQAQVARAIASGFAEHAIGEALDLAPSTVATYAAHAAAKIGLPVAQLRFLLPAGIAAADLDTALARPLPCPHGARWDGETFTLPMPAVEAPASLTWAERHVLRLALGGASNKDIALARGTSPRTVANQLSSLYAKLGVGSRSQLDPGLLPALGGAR